MDRPTIFAAFVAVTMFASVSLAGHLEPDLRCSVCTCDNEEVVCIEQEIPEVGEEGVCGPACSAIMSSFRDIDVVTSACAEVLACTAAQRTAPAAGPMWLSAAALGMVVFGGAALRRSRARSV